MKKRKQMRGHIKVSQRGDYPWRPKAGQIPAATRRAQLLKRLEAEELTNALYRIRIGRVGRDVQALIDAGLVRIVRTRRLSANRNELRLTYTPVPVTVARVPQPYARRLQWIKDMEESAGAI